MPKRKVTLENRGEVTLTDADHLATGGEGSAFKKGNTVIKIYTDPDKMRRDGMVEKITRLLRLSHEYIIAPSGLVTDDSSKPIGYYMPYAVGEPLARVFTTDFRTREGMTEKDTLTLVDRMRETVQFVHSKKAFMVDPNELNWMAEFDKKEGPKPKSLDVDSYVVDGIVPSTVPKMPSIRDWHSPLVSAPSDWFAWGIVSFQVFTGIHPYKGMVDGYKPAELERRMQDKVSVFAPGVRLNRAVRDFACIPGKLRGWYEAAFQGTERMVPPSSFDTSTAPAKAAAVARVVVSTVGNVVYEKIFSKVNDPVLRVFLCEVVLLASGALVDLQSKRTIATATSKDVEVVKVSGGWLKADKPNGTFSFSFISDVSFTETVLDFKLTGHHLVRYENRLFLVTDQGLMELSFVNPGKPILSSGKTWGALVNSTRWFDGAGVIDAMGAKFLIVPFEESSCAQVRIRELDGLTPVSAKAGSRFVTVIAADRQGNYKKLEFTFDASYQSYQVWEGYASGPEINVAILPKGVCATINVDGELVIFVPRNGTVNKVADRGVTTDMALSNLDNTVVYVHGGCLWKVSLKK